MTCTRLVPLLAALLVYAASAVDASFPFYDNCRRNPRNSGYELVALAPKKMSNGNTQFCFQVNVKKSCQPEIFTMKGQRVTSRCCNTTFAKVKLWVDPACRWQFTKSTVTVNPRYPKSAAIFNKIVSPTWTAPPQRSVEQTEVQYTQFGPIPQKVVDGTQFCLVMQPGPCKLNDYSSFTNPAARKQKMFQVAIYDRKKDDYECCPTFTFPMSA